MEKSRDNLQFSAKHKVESKKDFDRGRKLTQKKKFQPVEFTNEVIASYEDNSTSDENFTKEYEAKWICKRKKKRFQTENPYQLIMKDLVINDKEDVLEQQPKNVKDWNEQLMQEFFQEQDQEAKKCTRFGINNFSKKYDPSNL